MLVVPAIELAAFPFNTNCPEPVFVSPVVEFTAGKISRSLAAAPSATETLVPAPVSTRVPVP